MTRAAQARVAVLVLLVVGAGAGLFLRSSDAPRQVGQSGNTSTTGLANPVAPPPSGGPRSPFTPQARDDTPDGAATPNPGDRSPPGEDGQRENTSGGQTTARARPAAASPLGQQPEAPAPVAPVANTHAHKEAGRGFRDRANFGAEFAATINRELFPLASECIDLALARNPTLSGLLAVSLEVVPIDDDRALVATVEPTQANEIDDPDLFECIEQSSFSVEGLPSARSFEITMPIGVDSDD